MSTVESKISLLTVRLGALALAVQDLQSVSRPEEVAADEPDAPLLNSVAQNPGLKVDELARIVGMSHSGTVRAIDRLVLKGLVGRHPHPGDARAVALRPTEKGLAVAARFQDRRREAALGLFGKLQEREVDTLLASVDEVLGLLIGDRESCDRACRLCDETVCQVESCPAESFARKDRMQRAL
jgi:DNA-binding MarR family transcriptional regulator